MGEAFAARTRHTTYDDPVMQKFRDVAAETMLGAPLISGGARGQGAAEAKLFAREGAKVVLGDILDNVRVAQCRAYDASIDFHEARSQGLRNRGIASMTLSGMPIVFQCPWIVRAWRRNCPRGVIIPCTWAMWREKLAV
jgi:hypothetical protein